MYVKELETKKKETSADSRLTINHVTLLTIAFVVETFAIIGVGFAYAEYGSDHFSEAYVLRKEKT